MSSLWIDNGGVIREGGALILCDTCPCVGTASASASPTDYTGTGTLENCSRCPDGRAPDHMLLEVSGMGEIETGTPDGYPELCDCSEFNGSTLMGHTLTCYYTFDMGEWCDDPNFGGIRWIGSKRIDILEGTNPGTYKIRVQIYIASSGGFLTCGQAGEVYIIHELDNISQQCWDIEDLNIPYVSHTCYRRDADGSGNPCPNGGNEISCDDWANPCSNYDGLTITVSAA